MLAQLDVEVAEGRPALSRVAAGADRRRSRRSRVGRHQAVLQGLRGRRPRRARGRRRLRRRGDHRAGREAVRGVADRRSRTRGSTTRRSVSPATAKSVDIKDKEMTHARVRARHRDEGHQCRLPGVADARRRCSAATPARGCGCGCASRRACRTASRPGRTPKPFDEAGGFGGYAIVAPQNLAKAKASMLEEIDKIVDAARSRDDELQAREGRVDQGAGHEPVERRLRRCRCCRARAFRGRTTEFTQAAAREDPARSPRPTSSASRRSSSIRSGS